MFEHGVNVGCVTRTTRRRLRRALHRIAPSPRANARRTGYLRAVEGDCLLAELRVPHEGTRLRREGAAAAS